jgi:hypothetical protein
VGCAACDNTFPQARRWRATIGFSWAVRDQCQVFVSATAAIWPDGHVDPDVGIQARGCITVSEEAVGESSATLYDALRGTHYTPSSRNHHWNRVRAAAGLGDMTLYLATRHYFGYYALNLLDLEPSVIAVQLGHRDGGRLVEELYGHRDKRKSLRSALCFERAYRPTDAPRGRYAVVTASARPSSSLRPCSLPPPR